MITVCKTTQRYTQSLPILYSSVPIFYIQSGKIHIPAKKIYTDIVSDKCQVCFRRSKEIDERFVILLLTRLHDGVTASSNMLT